MLHIPYVLIYGIAPISYIVSIISYFFAKYVSKINQVNPLDSMIPEETKEKEGAENE